MRRGSRPATDRLWHRHAAVLGLIFGLRPAILASLFPQIAGLNQLGVVVLGAILGRRTGMSPSIADDPPFAAADPVDGRS
jgi:hypothetical protein